MNPILWQEPLQKKTIPNFWHILVLAHVLSTVGES
jgi:hypothetical protein